MTQPKMQVGLLLGLRETMILKKALKSSFLSILGFQNLDFKSEHLFFNLIYLMMLIE
jgi:hypothetical protein